MIESYISLGIHIGILAVLGLGIMGLSYLLAPKKVPKVAEWDRPYECGLVSSGLPQDRYPIKYYLVAILFVLFDIEVIFLYPWAVSFSVFKESSLQTYWFTEMLIFILILLIGYFYIVSKGVFLWSERE